MSDLYEDRFLFEESFRTQRLDSKHLKRFRELEEIEYLEHLLLEMGEVPSKQYTEDGDDEEYEYLKVCTRENNMLGGLGREWWGNKYLDVLPLVEPITKSRRMSGLRTVDEVRTDEDLADILGFSQAEPDIPVIQTGQRLKDGKNIYYMELEGNAFTWTNLSLFNFLLLALVIFVFLLILHLLFIRFLQSIVRLIRSRKNRV